MNKSIKEETTMKNPRGGRLMAEERDPDLRCARVRPDDTRCGNYASRGSTYCRFHGANAQVAIVERVMAETGLEPVKPRDFPTVAAQYVTAFNEEFVIAKEELGKLRLLHDENTIHEEYSHFFRWMTATTLTVTKLMDAAAKLNIVVAIQQAQLRQDQAKLVAELLSGSLDDAGISQDDHCRVRDAFLNRMKALEDAGLISENL